MAEYTLVFRLLQRIERAGNKLPHPSLLFIYLCFFILLLSTFCSMLGASAVHPLNGNTISSVNLLSKQGLQLILTHTVSNFTQFAPVGSVLVAIMGIGIAEHSGLIGATLKATILKAPAKLLSFVIVLTGVLSSLALDTGYVVLVPLAAIVFQSAGRHPIAGIAAAFAGVSGGFSANLLIGPFDAILAGISTEAAALVEPGYEVSAAANYYFIIVSTIVISLVGTWVTEKVVIPQLGEVATDKPNNSVNQPLSAREKSGLRATVLFSLVFLTLLTFTLYPEDGILRGNNGGVLDSPFMKGIVTLIALYAALAGIIYGRVSGQYQRSDAFLEGMENSLAAMASYLVLMFFAAQFVSYFSWSQLGAITAINGAELLKSLQLSPGLLLVVFILMSALINLLIGSASAKWALFAPIFVPMFLLLGISPEATQVAYRIGDSTTNIISPLMPYFGVVIVFFQRYDKQAGIGTVVAMMLPYSLAFLGFWTLLLVIWMGFGWPLGPGAYMFLE